jgi:fluoride exporter
MWPSVFAVSLGSAIGALLRWQFNLKLNSLWPAMPMGTLAANLVGGYIVGLAVAYFSQATEIAPEWRLLIVVGFCGGLTTFSTFSAEVLTMLQQAKFAWALATVGVHVIGSLLMTWAGMATWALFQGK